ncbi:MAG: RluA family pseudouridine synthase [Clostridiaceae bacterium]|nr:RluA family pseudouridine synthase [Clostridiaceae bacterium]
MNNNLSDEKVFYMDNSEVRLDRWLAEQMPEYSRSQIAQWIKDRKIQVENFSELKTRTILPAGTKITLRVQSNPASLTQLRPQAMALDIIYEDADMLIINKPIGLTVHPGAGNQDKTLVNALLAYTEGDLSDLAGPERAGIVHRLDKDTSGLLLVAKNNHFHLAMTELFKKRQVTRKYRALVWNKPETKTGTINAPIGRSPNNRTKMAVVANGKAAITHFRLIKDFVNSEKKICASELEVELYSGRTHQIRVHLAYINLPIIGDPLYNLKKDDLGMPAQALYAAYLAFIHPLSGFPYQFEIQPPNYYRKAKEYLEKMTDIVT